MSNTASFLILLAIAGGLRSAALQRPKHFELTLQRSGNGWTAKCNAGCRWQRLSFDFKGRPALISNVGVGPVTKPGTDESFAFRFQPTKAGWAAEGVRGTAWRAVTWSCGTASCRVQIDELGVSAR